MRVLQTLFGYPHEALHALALLLIGRRAVRVTRAYTDIPDDLTTPQYVFVAGLPALVFWGFTAACLLALLNAGSVDAAALAAAGAIVGTIAGYGTVGDLALIARRLMPPHV